MTYLLSLSTDPPSSTLFLSNSSFLSLSVSFIHFILSFIFHSSSHFVSAAAASLFQSSPLQRWNIKMRFDESVIRLQVFCPLSPFWRRLLVLKAKKMCVCVRPHEESVSPLSQNLHISSLIFHLASKNILKFCSDSDLLQGGGGEAEGRMKKESGRERRKTVLPLLHSHHLGWINEKSGPRQVQHEKVMGSLCSQNAIRAILTLRADVAAMSGGKVNIHVVLKENQCTPLSLLKLKCLYLHHQCETFELSVKDECLWFLSTLFSIWQPLKWKLLLSCSLSTQPSLCVVHFMLHEYTNSAPTNHTLHLTETDRGEQERAGGSKEESSSGS